MINTRLLQQVADQYSKGHGDPTSMNQNKVNRLVDAINGHDQLAYEVLDRALFRVLEQAASDFISRMPRSYGPRDRRPETGG